MKTLIEFLIEGIEALKYALRCKDIILDGVTISIDDVNDLYKFKGLLQADMNSELGELRINGVRFNYKSKTNWPHKEGGPINTAESLNKLLIKLFDSNWPLTHCSQEDLQGYARCQFEYNELQRRTAERLLPIIAAVREVEQW